MIRIIHLFYGMPVNSYPLIQESENIPEAEHLGPVMEPDSVAFSFDTPGWYLLGILLILGLFYVLFKWIKKYRANAYRREALKKVLELNAKDGERDFTFQLSALMIILKNVALKAYGRNSVATLHGNAWLSFLESKSKNIQFVQFQPMISKTIYENQTPDEKELGELKNLSIKWIKTHA